MTWLTWRQHRQQAFAGALTLALLGAFFLLTGRQMVTAYSDSGLAACFASSGDCSTISGEFQSRFTSMHSISELFLVLPALVGLFWGAPLVAREIEQGTHRLVWTQSITRGRWISAKLLLIAVATVTAAAPLAWLMTWWLGPLNHATATRFNPGFFDLQGVVPVGYALFALALGTAAGAVLRRTLPAMAVTLGGFAAVRFTVAALIRPRLQAPLHTSVSGAHTGVMEGTANWVLSETVFAYGHPVQTFRSLCPPLDRQCLRAADLHTLITYQPASRFWFFQTTETAIFTGLAAALLILTIWWTRRRIA
jgi:hypothetical protein